MSTLTVFMRKSAPTHTVVAVRRPAAHCHMTHLLSYLITFLLYLHT